MKINNLFRMIVEISCCYDHIYPVELLVVRSHRIVHFFKFTVLCEEVVVVVPSVGDRSSTRNILFSSILPTYSLYVMVHCCSQYYKIVPVGWNYILSVRKNHTRKLLLDICRGNFARVGVVVFEIRLLACCQARKRNRKK